uniref:Uncharacterized protein n=1 Tax=Rhizophora mucronata TaxID=61149 RepID=A0A2P2NSM2_RHIMU
MAGLGFLLMRAQVSHIPNDTLMKCATIGSRCSYGMLFLCLVVGVCFWSSFVSYLTCWQFIYLKFATLNVSFLS